MAIKVPVLRTKRAGFGTGKTTAAGRKPATTTTGRTTKSTGKVQQGARPTKTNLAGKSSTITSHDPFAGHHLPARSSRPDDVHSHPSHNPSNAAAPHRLGNSPMPSGDHELLNHDSRARFDSHPAVGVQRQSYHGNSNDDPRLRPDTRHAAGLLGESFHTQDSHLPSGVHPSSGTRPPNDERNHNEGRWGSEGGHYASSVIGNFRAMEDQGHGYLHPGPAPNRPHTSQASNFTVHVPQSHTPNSLGKDHQLNTSGFLDPNHHPHADMSTNGHYEPHNSNRLAADDTFLRMGVLPDRPNLPTRSKSAVGRTSKVTEQWMNGGQSVRPGQTTGHDRPAEPSAKN